MLALVVDDDLEICRFFNTVLQKMGCRCHTAHTISQATELDRAHDFDLVLLDLELPDGNGLDIMPALSGAPSSPEIIIITGTGDARGAEMAFKYGAWDYVQKPFQLDEVALPIQRAIQYRKEKLASPRLVPLKRSKIIGDSPAIRKSLEDVGRAAATDASVIVTGETGTGKELFARAIHENSRRASHPFVAVDCGALTESLIESTLFGHEKGAFTGATSRQDGLIVQAHGGTLMLDEIGEMPLGVQKTFLRTLQEKTVRPVGGRKELEVDIRLISATNRDLARAVAENSFREDLFFRIRALEIHLPPLRQREKDIEDIVLKKVHDLSIRYRMTPKAASPEFIETLENNPWPGNIRELINVLEHALASAGNDPTLVPKHLPPAYRLSGIGFNLSPEPTLTKLVDQALGTNDDFPPLNACREGLEKAYLEKLLNKAAGRRETACRLSGLSQARLYALLKKYHLPGFAARQR